MAVMTGRNNTKKFCKDQDLAQGLPCSVGTAVTVITTRSTASATTEALTPLSLLVQNENSGLGGLSGKSGSAVSDSLNCRHVASPL